ncbi:MAG: ABC transporter permease [Gemmatimonadota bacterium]
MDTVFQDLRYAFRSLRKSPGFAAIAVLCIALGIGVNTTIFSAFNGLFLRPLPFAAPDRLVSINEASTAFGGWSWNEVAYPNFVDWTEESDVFAGAAAYEGHAFNLSGESAPVYVGGGAVSTSFFEVLGVRPLIGRGFLPDEGEPGPSGVMVLGHDLWQQRFGGDPRVVGRTLRLDGEPHTVIGVMPAGFRFPERSELWVPLSLDPDEGRGNHSYPNVARLAPGATIAQANAALAPITERLQRDFPETNATISALVVPLRDSLLAGEVKTILYIMLAAVGFVLLIACANVANLFLARATERRDELAIRSAVGAGRGRLVRQLLNEGLIVAAAGGAVGILIAAWGLDLIRMGIPVDLPYWIRFDIDGRVLLFTFAISMGTGLVSAILPALRASRPDVNEVLKKGGRRGAGRTRNRLRGALVVSELALSVVLLIGATLMIRSFLGLQHADPGFDPARLLSLSVHLAGDAYDADDERTDFLSRTIELVEALPGVESAAAVNLIPLSGSNTSTSFTVEGQPVAAGEEPGADYRPITTGYFRTLGIPLLSGRDFTESEVRGEGQVVIVNETMAERFWTGKDAVGKRIRLSGGDEWQTVVGVARDVQEQRLGEPAESQFYQPYSQRPWATMSLVVRTSLPDPARVVPSIRGAIAGIDPSLALYQIEPLEQVVERSFWDRRLYGWIFAAFAGIALLLAAMGVYGVTAYTVSRRTHEIGIRMAMGAEARHVISRMIGQGLRPVLLGLGLGLVLAFGVTRVLAGFLYGLAPTDPLTFAGIALFLALIALLACYLPAWRATRVDPLIALRDE